MTASIFLLNGVMSIVNGTGRRKWMPVVDVSFLYNCFYTDMYIMTKCHFCSTSR